MKKIITFCVLILISSCSSKFQQHETGEGSYTIIRGANTGIITHIVVYTDNYRRIYCDRQGNILEIQPKMPE